MRLIDRKWPTERETIEEAIEFERVEQKLARVFGMYAFGKALSRGPDPYGERLEDEGNESLRRWIASHRR